MFKCSITLLLKLCREGHAKRAQTLGRLCPCAFKGVVHARERRSVDGIAECRGYLEQTIHPESTAGPGVELLSQAEALFVHIECCEGDARRVVRCTAPRMLIWRN